jgi:CheY-like chemotaxis protein
MAKCILIVEDDRDVARSVADVLEAEGFSIFIAANGREALDHLHKSEPPALILLDMTMPVMNGWEFRREQEGTAQIAAIPVVVLTADGDAYRKATSINAHGHLIKPVGIDELLNEVQRLCGEPDP